MPTPHTTERVTLRAVSGPDAGRSYWAVERYFQDNIPRNIGRTFSTARLSAAEGSRFTANIVPPKTPAGKDYVIEFCYQAAGGFGSVAAELELRIVEVLPHHEFRVAEERKELGERMGKLSDYMASPAFKELDLVDRFLLGQQLGAVWLYDRSLEMRQQHWERKRNV